jgi:hypothetical protein
MTVYLLAERIWVPTQEGKLTVYFRSPETGVEPARLFLDPSKAEAERLRRERAARAERIPFLYGSDLDAWTGWGPHPLFDWLLDAGLEPLPSLEPSRSECLEWWKRESAEMTDSQRDKVWEALDRVRFFEVIEEEIENG